ncbi:hypothetical protein [Sanguibacter suarezii]|uniref:hypothetical protein n=1 Tax=Sanguibacter suarezii TaxID=60921 RepID=UPI00082A893C|nr:hypothetical protein [Sanguibacter suarezii]
MVDDDPIDDIHGVAMTAGTALSRVAESVLRHAQDRRRLAQQTIERASEDARARESAQREIADRHFSRAQRPDFLETADPRAIAQTWHAAQDWKDREPERFTAAADGLNAQFEARYGIDLSAAVDQGAARELVTDAAETRIVKVRELEQQQEREREEAHEAQRLIRDAEAKEAMALMTAEGPEQDRLLSEAQVHRREASARETGETRASDDHRSEVQTATSELMSAQDAPASATTPLYDSPERRAASEREMAAAGVPEQARKARMTADQMNARNPREAATATAAKKKAAVGTVAAGRSRDTGRSR